MSSPDRPYCPDDGDLIWIDFDPRSGNEQAGTRPAIVLSPRKYNMKARLCVVCPIMTRVKGYPFEVPLPEGAAVSGVVLSDQIKCLSWEKGAARFAGRASKRIQQDVRAKMKALLSL